MNIFLYIVNHQEGKIPFSPCLIPIRSDQAIKENIAHLENYCELRAQYWVWKNILLQEETAIGFFHYRRYLDFSTIWTDSLSKRPKPYRIQKEPDGTAYTQEELSVRLGTYDVVAPVWEYTGISVKERYARSSGHHIADLQTVMDIIRERYPAYHTAAKQYLMGKGEYYGNIFVMRQSVFMQYCAWLFDILEEFDRRVIQPLPRTNGYLGERLFGIWLTYQKQQGIRWCECPRIHFTCYDDERHHFKTAQMVNFLLPPGSKRRSWLRYLKYRDDGKK